ncbi:hypothetical protein JCGZ_25608 [Jatropha curcas]|uniref:Uncharacterized protein n=1 Tax=Jatropha curcas TaxID=180498 RepID=A0A067JKA8_JATCU|nr:hypothetical protein JCGZ_25608 [Jatropha curcas]
MSESPHRVEVVGTRIVDGALRKQPHAPEREEQSESSGGACAQERGRTTTRFGQSVDRRSFFLLRQAVTTNSHFQRCCMYLRPLCKLKPPSKNSWQWL